MRLPGSLGRYYQYIRYVVLHKVYVLRAGCSMGIPLLAALHDNSKFLPGELIHYARHFYNPDGSKKTRMAKDGFYEDDPDDLAFDRAWLLHVRRNKHHPQHWIFVTKPPCGDFQHCDELLFEDDGTVKCLGCREEGRSNWSYSRDDATYIVREMPERYLTEMLADWVGAGLAQGTPNTLGWYTARGRNHILGPRTREIVESRLGYSSPVAATEQADPCDCCLDAGRFPGSGAGVCPSCGHTPAQCYAS